MIKLVHIKLKRMKQLTILNKYLINDKFSGYENYYRLDVNDRNATNAIVRDADIKFLIHGYTDRVQFNKTGLTSSF